MTKQARNLAAAKRGPRLSTLKKRARSLQASFRKLGHKFTSRALFHEMRDSRCPYCGASLFAVKPSVDHVIPRSRGGTNHLSNLAVCCFRCNRLKSSLSPGEFQALTEFLRLQSREARENIERRLLAAGWLYQ